MALDGEIRARAKYWASSPAFDQATHGEIARLLEQNNEKELTDRFYRDLEFGTGGLRGILGAGTARMNIYNIRKASTALAEELLAQFPSQKVSLAISYDSRHFSKEFARATAEVMAAHAIKVYITKELRPVPMLSYMVRHFKCQGGVCVTASHNPPNYNGYKVYWAHGGQITPPYDELVIKRYGEITGYESLKYVAYDVAKAKGLIEEVGHDFDELYFREVEKLSIYRDGRDDFKIVFTPLHGSAGYPVSEMLERYGFKDVYIVPEQKEPNGDFPTVKFPNPEDPAALKMAVDLGTKVNADLVLGTDPDCDRVGIVAREGKEFIYLNGNQIGCLLIEYVLSGLKATGRLPRNPLVIKTIVTTDLQNKIAEHYGAYVEETLTGFKWICQVMEDYETGARKPYREYVCGGEESYGFLAGRFVRDKDGVSACTTAAEMTAHYKARGLRLSQVLDQIYRRHGVYHESLYTLTLPGKSGADAISAIMKKLRASPPRELDGIAVEKVRDLQNSQEYLYASGSLKPIGNIPLPPSNVLQFILQDGSKISARPSGTEPKIKFYISVRETIQPDASEQELEATKGNCAARVKRLEKIFVELAQI